MSTVGRASILLKLRANDSIYAVVETDLYDHDPEGNNLPYWFDEHTCPTNWTRNIVYLIEGNDSDPHGIFQFCAMVPKSIQEHDRSRNMNVEEISRFFGFNDLKEIKLLSDTTNEQSS